MENGLNIKWPKIVMRPGSLKLRDMSLSPGPIVETNRNHKTKHKRATWEEDDEQ